MTNNSSLSVVDTLKSEHELIMLGFAIMENVCRRHDESQTLNPDHFERLSCFFSEFTDQIHHAKEDNILFSFMEQNGINDENDLIGSLTADHNLGRILREVMDDSISRIRANDQEAALDLVETARCYLTLMVHHICRENGVLCDFIERELTAERLEKMADEFAQSDKNNSFLEVWTKHEAVLKELQAEFGANEDILKLNHGG